MKNDLTIFPKNKIVDALKKLNKTAEKVLFVTDNNGKLLGTLSDGDIRRFILSKGEIDGTVEECYNKKPTYVIENNYTDELIKKLMLEKHLEIIPIVNLNREIIDYLTWTEVFGSKKIIENQLLNIPVVIMAGGRGKRLEPFTKIIPKPLIPIGKKTMIEYVIESFLNYGIKKFFITINYKGDLIESYFKTLKKDFDVKFIREKNFLGTAGSLFYLKNKINTNFIVSNCDIILNVNYYKVYKFHLENNSLLTSITSIKHVKIPYGVVEIEKKGKIHNIIEKPEYTFQINTGVYILNNAVFDYIKEEKYLDMPSLFSELLKNKEKIFAFPINECNYIDFGQWEEFKKNSKKFEK